MHDLNKLENEMRILATEHSEITDSILLEIQNAVKMATENEDYKRENEQLKEDNENLKTALEITKLKQDISYGKFWWLNLTVSILSVLIAALSLYFSLHTNDSSNSNEKIDVKLKEVKPR